jgi:hypothetical protein
MSDCYFDGSGCLICPEQEAAPAVPARVDHQVVIGWNAGANSIAVQDGNLHVVVTNQALVAAVVVGLKSDRDRQTVPDLIEHGWYFQSLAGVGVAQVIERGVTKTMVAAYDFSDAFELRRVNGLVTYLKNDAAVYTSTVPSLGSKVVNSCLYASGDNV